MTDNRKSLHEIYMNTALSFAERSTCNRKKVGGVIVKDGRIVGTGYNGSPQKTPHCIDVECLIIKINGKPHCIRTLHCEQAIISFCARYGISLNQTELYVTLSPCYDCSKLLINTGIKKVFFLEEYSDLTGLELLNNAGIPCEKMFFDK